MTADKIKQIAENLPSELGGSSYAPPSVVLPGNKRISFPVDKQLGSFIHIYKNAAIGWHSAAIFAASGKDYPVALTGEDHWVFKAYLYCRNPERYSDKNVMEAIIIAHPEMKNVRDVIESLLLTSDHDSPEKISKATGIDKRTISAYEKLFFNVLDRKKDLMYIRNIVYPDSRLVEMFDGYAANEDFGMLMKRYGYNHSSGELLYLAGLPGIDASDMSGPSAAGRLEASFMTQGYMLTKLGFVNQTANTTAIYHARTVMSAAKQGGQDTSGDSLPMSSIAEALYTTFRDEGIAKAEYMDDVKQATRYKDQQAGTVVEI